MSTRTAQDREYLIGDWTFLASLFQLTRGQHVVKLEPRTARLLLYLAENAGSSISRDRIMQAVWPNMIVSDEALSNAVNKLRKALGDDRRHPRFIETIPKMGYRLIAPVKDTGESQHDTFDSAEDEVPVARPLSGLRIYLAGLVLTIGLGALLLYLAVPQSPHGELPSNNPSIAVMPFLSLSHDPKQEFLADAFTDDLITQLAKNPNLLVIARDSTFLYKDKPTAIPDLVEKLGVRYVLHGSVRRRGDSLRINAQLVDARNERLLWSEQYDRSTEDIFDLQHDITANIADALPAMVDIGNRAAETHAPTANLDAYEKFTHGRNHFYLYANKNENQTARDFYQSAINLDPGFAEAYAMLGWTHAFDAMNGWSADREQSLDNAMRFANEAIALDADQPIAYFVRGLAYRERKEYIKAMGDAEKAIELNPSYANGHLLLSSLLYYGGRPEEGLALIKRSMRLNPHHPYNYSFHLGQAYFVLKRYREAIAALREAVASYPSSERLHVWLAASYAYTGHIDEANWEADQIMAINPDFSLERVKDVYPFIDEADRDHVIEGLRMAGLSR